MYRTEQEVEQSLRCRKVEVLYIDKHGAASGKAIGGGDIKLMAYAGLLLGARNILLAFVLACILGSVLHTIRMKVSKRNNLLAMGPYLSAGIYIAALWGDRFWTWYLGMMGIY